MIKSKTQSKVKVKWQEFIKTYNDRKRLTPLFQVKLTFKSFLFRNRLEHSLMGKKFK